MLGPAARNCGAWRGRTKAAPGGLVARRHRLVAGATRSYFGVRAERGIKSFARGLPRRLTQGGKAKPCSARGWHLTRYGWCSAPCRTPTDNFGPHGWAFPGPNSLASIRRVPPPPLTKYPRTFPKLNCRGGAPSVPTSSTDLRRSPHPAALQKHLATPAALAYLPLHGLTALPPRRAMKIHQNPVRTLKITCFVPCK